MDFTLMLLTPWVHTSQGEPMLPAGVGRARGLCGIIVVLVLKDLGLNLSSIMCDIV